MTFSYEEGKSLILGLIIGHISHIIIEILSGYCWEEQSLSFISCDIIMHYKI